MPIRWSPELKARFEAVLTRHGMVADYGVVAHAKVPGQSVDWVQVHDGEPYGALYVIPRLKQRHALVDDLIALFVDAAAPRG